MACSGMELDRGARHAQILRQGFGNQRKVLAAFHGRDHHVVGTGGGGAEAKVCKEPLHPPQVNPEPNDLHEAAAAADDLIQFRQGLGGPGPRYGAP